MKFSPIQSDCESHFDRLYRFDHEITQRLNQDRPVPVFLTGCDEVGRGSLIGPVVAAAVSFRDLTPHDMTALSALNDSKQMKADTRTALASHLLTCARVGIGEASRAEVDSLNVHQSSLLAMARAVGMLFSDLTNETNTDIFALLHQNDTERAAFFRQFQSWPLNPDVYLLIDGRSRIKDFPAAQQQPVIKGDGQSACIAAASVVAKTYRDELMVRYAQDYPDYGWDSNMGYPTPVHQSAIQRLGITPLHRSNYKTVQNARQTLLPL